MLWTAKLTRESVTAHFRALVKSGVTPDAAYEQVEGELSEVHVDLLESDLPTDDVADLLMWWDLDVDYRAL